MLYAAYGSNLHPTRLAQRVRSASPIGTGYLPDWSLECHKRSKDGSAKFNIIAGGDGVHVAIFELSADDKKLLDDIEGVGAGYRAVNLPVQGFGNCATYIAEDSYVDESLHPYDWYKQLVVLGARSQCFPVHYRKMIEALTACEDPDESRNASNWRIVKAIASDGRPDAK